jgi:hypothetical protein
MKTNFRLVLAAATALVVASMAQALAVQPNVCATSSAAQVPMDQMTKMFSTKLDALGVTVVDLKDITTTELDEENDKLTCHFTVLFSDESHVVGTMWSDGSMNAAGTPLVRWQSDDYAALKHPAAAKHHTL